MATVLALARVLLLAYAGYLVLVFVVQRRVAFPGTARIASREASAVPERVEQVWLGTSFGRVEAWFMPAVGSGPTLVFAHGNGELIDDWAAAMDMLVGQGVGVLLVEFPGYGHSDGEPTRATIKESFDAAFDWLAQRDDVDAARIVAYGRSMGGGAAADLAGARPVAALVLQSTFSSVAAMVRGNFVPRFVVRDRFDNAVAVGGARVPVLLLHGRDDEVIPFAHAERIARAREGLEIVEIPCGHNDCASVWPEIVVEITRFLVRHGLLAETGDGG